MRPGSEHLRILVPAIFGCLTGKSGKNIILETSQKTDPVNRVKLTGSVRFVQSRSLRRYESDILGIQLLSIISMMLKRVMVCDHYYRLTTIITFSKPLSSYFTVRAYALIRDKYHSIHYG